MNILFVCASDIEAKIFKNNLNSKNHKIDILVTGIGIPPTIFELQKHLNEKAYDMVINAGIAGSFNKTIQLGEVVVVQNDIFADYIIEDKALVAIHETNLRSMLPIELRRGWLMPPIPNVPFQGKKVLGITSNRISGVAEAILQRKEYFAADIETMEGAAVFYVCMKMNVPVIQIRAISNYIEERDTSKWEISTALQNLYTEVQHLIELLN